MARSKIGWSRYRTYGIYGSSSKPPISEVEMSVLPTGSAESGIWWQLYAVGDWGPAYTIKLLVGDLGFLEPYPQPTKISRYLFWEEGKTPLEYIDSSTGMALGPNFDFTANLLPHANVEDAKRPFFEVGSYLGHPIHIADCGADPTDRIPRAEVLRLNTRLTMGTGRYYRNAEDIRLYQPGEPIPPERPEYEYRNFTPEDYDELVDVVGMNIFRVLPEQVRCVEDKPVFFIYRSPDGADFPAMLYRSNYKGVTMYMDEPAWIVKSPKDAKTPGEAASRLVEAIRRFSPTGNTYGSRSLAKSLNDVGMNLGDLDIVENFPVWETVTSAIWYEFKAGLNGFVHESRFQPKRFSRQVGETFGVDFPEEPLACIDFHYAWFRGAGRHFGRPWGMAIYGQMGLETAKLVFNRAYDSGAEFLWFWTSDHEHHVPYLEQKEHTIEFRKYEATNPRSSVETHLNRADTAIALPYGYLMDDLVMDSGSLWRNDVHLGLDMKNQSGTTYREVLTAAMGLVADGVKSGDILDLVYWGGGESIRGYGRVYKILEDATVQECRSC